MKVLIPLAGLGTRLRPHTYTKPKPLLNVAGKPVLAYILDRLVGVPDIEEIIFIVGYLGDQIEEYVDSHYDFPTRYVEQAELKGQAHALYLAKDYLGGPVLIVFVDTIFDTDVNSLADEAMDGVIYVKEVEDPRRFGVVVVEDGVRVDAAGHKDQRGILPGRCAATDDRPRGAVPGGAGIGVGGLWQAGGLVADQPLPSGSGWRAGGGD